MYIFKILFNYEICLHCQGNMARKKIDWKIQTFFKSIYYEKPCFIKKTRNANCEPSCTNL